MRRSLARKKALSVSLFPFLAVLICTMGALIVLLVVVVQQARAHAEAVAAEDVLRQEAASAAQLAAEEQKRLELEENDWRAQVLAQQRQEMANKLAEQRNRLSHLEEHFQRLRDDLAKALEDARRLESADGQESRNVASLQEQIEQTRRLIEQARRELAEAQQGAAAKPKSFTLVPYVGPNGTRRRPIYVECLDDRVILQPEGVTLVEGDFTGPLDAGNPFDAALRAVRDYWASQGSVAAHGEPYPLLVVRPGAAVSYSAARSAMKSWDSEFGYELVEENLVLAYPPPDPALKDRLEKVIAESRRRQEILKASRPSLYGEAGPKGFRAAHRGGLVAVDEGGSGESSYPRDTFAWGSKRSGSAMGPDEGEGEPSKPGAMGSKESQGGATAPPPPGAQQGGEGGAASRPGSMAASRGRNWGLPNAARGAVGYTRPIAARCSADRLLLMPERGGGESPQAILFDGATQRSVDALVGMLWKRIETWGIAGPGAYWKPVLRVDVAPDGEDRFRDLQLLLQDSGIELERKSP